MASTGPEIHQAAPLTAQPGRASSRWLNKPPSGGWGHVVFGEWELTAATWTDQHSHDEFNYVLEGELIVECNGMSVVAVAGDLVRVPGGAIGRYTATRYARMLSAYPPDPTGSAPTSMSYAPLANDPGSDTAQREHP